VNWKFQRSAVASKALYFGPDSAPARELSRQEAFTAANGTAAGQKTQETAHLLYALIRWLKYRINTTAPNCPLRGVFSAEAIHVDK
jgi:hypothetical protein